MYTFMYVEVTAAALGESFQYYYSVQSQTYTHLHMKTIQQTVFIGRT